MVYILGIQGFIFIKLGVKKRIVVVRRCHPGPVDCLGIINITQLQTSDPLGDIAKAVLGDSACRDDNLSLGCRGID